MFRRSLLLALAGLPFAPKVVAKTLAPTEGLEYTRLSPKKPYILMDDGSALTIEEYGARFMNRPIYASNTTTLYQYSMTTQEVENAFPGQWPCSPNEFLRRLFLVGQSKAPVA